MAHSFVPAFGPDAIKEILAHIQGLLDESETSQPCYYKVVYRDTLEDLKAWIEDTFRITSAKMKEDKK